MNNHISEKISFLTQIHTSWDGTEQRQALRQEPRRYIAYDYTGMKEERSQYLRMLIYHSQTTAIRFPMWHAITVLEDTMYAGQYVVMVPTEYLWCYRNIGGVELWLNDNQGGKAFEFQYIGADGRLVLTTQLDDNWKRHTTKVMPVFYGVLAKDDSFTNRNDAISEMTLNLELLREQNAPEYFPEEYDEWHDEEVSSPWNFHHGLPETYLGAEVWRYTPQWADNLDANFAKNANRIDYETGIIKFDQKSYNPQENREITYLLHTRQMINNVQRFFYRHKGAWKSFYAPTWVNDFVLRKDGIAGAATLEVKLPWFWKYYNKSSRRKKICIMYKDATSEIYDVAGYSRDELNKYGIVFLESPLTHNIRRQDVKMICFWCRYRFGSDDLNVDYETNITATVSLVLKEVDE